MNREQRARLSKALYEIHKPSFYLAGLNEQGDAWLAAGNSLGPEPHQKPLAWGMNRYSCCRACNNHRARNENAWPCDTVKLLLEAGIIEPIDAVLAADQAEFEGTISHRADDPPFSANVRPDRKMEIYRWP